MLTFNFFYFEEGVPQLDEKDLNQEKLCKKYKAILKKLYFN